MSGTLVYEDIVTLVKNRAQCATATNNPLDATIASFINDAYLDLWDASGGRMRSVGSELAWTAANSCAGSAMGILNDIKDIVALWPVASSAAAAADPSVQSLACSTTSSATVGSSALFANVKRGMIVSGSGIPVGATVTDVATTSSITISHAATATANPVTLTFTSVLGARPLDRVDLDEILYRRGSYAPGTYGTPQCYSISPVAMTTLSVTATINRYQLDWWPSVTGYYFPMRYVAQFADLSAGLYPDVNDAESHDIAYLAAMRLVPLLGKTHLRESIAADLSARTAERLQRKIAAMMSGDQDASAT